MYTYSLPNQKLPNHWSKRYYQKQFNEFSSLYGPKINAIHLLKKMIKLLLSVNRSSKYTLGFHSGRIKTRY